MSYRTWLTLKEAIEALGVLPDGYCYCSKDRSGSKVEHEPECVAIRDALQGDDDRLAIVSGHLHDEEKRHRVTREALAREWGVEVDTEAYDAAWDQHVEVGGTP